MDKKFVRMTNIAGPLVRVQPSSTAAASDRFAQGAGRQQRDATC
jgi:hypothetical protein